MNWNWLDFIGIALIFPTIVVLISDFLTRKDEKIKTLHSQIINRLLSFKKGIDEDKTRTIESFSIEEALYEISKALEEEPIIEKESLREDIDYKVYAHKSGILKRLRKEIRREMRIRKSIVVVLIIVCILYVLIRFLVARLIKLEII